VSFVRSISMDAFKQNEILRMQHGGNKAWQDFYNKNATTPFDEATIKERYDCEVGEEWKERLAAQVEDREFDKATFLKERAAILQRQASRSATPAGFARNSGGAGGLGSKSGSRPASPAPVKTGGIPAEQKAQNEAYFARMGEANAARPDNLPPNQGGKYGGFGSAPPEPLRQQGGMPTAEEFTKDPVAALTKGFGWFSATVGKQAKIVNDSYIQPTAKTVCVPPYPPRQPSRLTAADCHLRLGQSSTQRRLGSRSRDTKQRQRGSRVFQPIRRRPRRKGQCSSSQENNRTGEKRLLGFVWGADRIIVIQTQQHRHQRHEERQRWQSARERQR